MVPRIVFPRCFCACETTVSLEQKRNHSRDQQASKQAFLDDDDHLEAAMIPALFYAALAARPGAIVRLAELNTRLNGSRGLMTQTAALAAWEAFVVQKLEGRG
jgi:hypothetical protein